MEKEAYRNVSVSTGTLLVKDLAERFLEVLETLNPEARKSFMEPVSWDTEEAGEALEELWEALRANGPEGCYFGSHPDDGADFGFWEDIED